MTERLHFHFSLSCIGEGNGNPLQCSCLENPRDGGAWGQEGGGHATLIFCTWPKRAGLPDVWGLQEDSWESPGLQGDPTSPS